MPKVDADLRSLIGEMESLVADHEKWASWFQLIALGEAPLERDAIYAMAVALEIRARKLMVLWKAAFHASGGDD